FYFGKLQTVPIPIEGARNLEAGKPEAVDFSLFWDAWNKLAEKYADAGKLDYKKMVYGAISGMTASLKDPYTVFMDPADTKRFLEDVSGSFEGVGMEVGIKNEELKVIAPLDGTPAQLAGVRAGDTIVKIDGQSTRSMSVEQAVSLIRGRKGTAVTLSLFREGWKDEKDFAITRTVITIPALKWELKDKDIAYVKLYHFSENAGDEFRRAAAQIIGSQAKRIVLDLRNNPGGYLEVAQDIAGWFVKKGDTVVIQDPGAQGEKKIFASEGSAALRSYPVVVLINEGSASASEILAGALRDNLGIALVGKKSFCKGSVQELEKLRDQSSLKITVAHWLTPKGDMIAEKGLEPDVKIDMTDEDYSQGKDPQLDKAIEAVRGL
ncbi:MAG: S41 family peptidase, partial [Candidatus Wildermuthbacteria bacterium]|nr:S41 family peptidase [Candidatus Wildermuthbacteria bacterium]